MNAESRGGKQHAAVASVIASFMGAGILAYVEPCAINVFGGDCDTRFNWAMFVGLGGGWSLGMGIPILGLLALRNAMRNL